MNQKISISVVVILLASVFALSAQTKTKETEQKGKKKVEKKNTLASDTIKLKKNTYRLEIGYNNPARYGAGISSTYYNGIKLGGTVEFGLKNNLSLLSGVLYNLVYADKLQKYPNSTSVTYTSWGHFLDIPIRLTYTYPLSKNLKIFGFAGPNIEIGLFQNLKTTSTVSYVPSAFSDLYKDAVLNRLNFQLGAGGGVQWKKYQLKAGYDFGLNNLNKLNTGGQFQKGWYVSFAYDF